MSKTHIYCHIVFGTKKRERTIFVDQKKELYKYIWGVVRNNKCSLLRINGGEDHIHLLIDLHPSIALANLVRDIKTSSSFWIRETRTLSHFNGWGREYYASSVSPQETDHCVEYIKSQEQHHNICNFDDELKDMSNKWGMTWHEDDLT